MKVKLLVFCFFSFIWTAKSQSDLTIGLLSIVETETIYNENWFSKKYERFIPDLVLLKEVKIKLRDCQIDIFMGVWCHDTKTHLPHFLKLFDTIEIPKEHIKIFNVNENKNEPFKMINKYNIKYLPTVIFSNPHGEIGRIVEYPYETIEEDILRIFLKDSTELVKQND